MIFHAGVAELTVSVATFKRQTTTNSTKAPRPQRKNRGINRASDPWPPEKERESFR